MLKIQGNQKYSPKVDGFWKAPILNCMQDYLLSLLQ